MTNQLRAHLETTLPGAIGLFRDLDSAISLTFLRRFPTQDKADWLSVARLGNWLGAQHYNHLANLDRLWTHLRGAPRGTTGAEAAARGQITLALVAALTPLEDQIAALKEQIAVQLAAHPDAVIFTSLPKAGTVRAARLFAEIGDARARYPTAEALTCLAGAAPSTRQSGKVKVVAYRWVADKQLRGAVIDFAGDSYHASPWAADLYRPPAIESTTIPTRLASSPAHGCMSSGATGKTASPTTPPNRRAATGSRAGGLTQGYSCPARQPTKSNHHKS